MSNDKQTLADELEFYALKINKTAVLFPAPNGGHFLYVSKRETDVLSACMSACIDIMIQRGDALNNPFKVRKVAGLIAPGNEYYWSVFNADGTETAGYAHSEEEANRKIKEYCLARMAQNG